MKFYLHRLGCPKNDVDADYLSACLIKAGHRPVADPDQADVAIVNTCGFILPAKEEAIDAILQLGRLRKSGQLRGLYATGCLSQRYGDQLLIDIPELDGAFGLGMLEALERTITTGVANRSCIRVPSHRLDYLGWERRYISDDFPYAYLKISDGCDRQCTFCAIPGIRGRYRSRSIRTLVDEAEFLASHGKKELILVSQEATLYGYDLPGRPTIVTLLRQLEQIEDIRWLRLLYLYPPKLDLETIEYMAADNKTLDYFDLPLQHVIPEILTAMRRPVGDDDWVAALIRSILHISPNAILRATFMVGFPGETDRHFAQLKDFVAAHKFHRLGVFAFSPEEGTPAEAFSGQVPEETKASRLDELMTLQQEIAFARNEDLIGSRQEVIIDAVTDDDHAVGRGRGDCPEIDQQVQVLGTGLSRGDIVPVRIDAADGYDLKGTLVEV